MTNLNLSNTCQMHPRERKRGGGGECICGCGHVDAIIGSSCWALLLLLLLLLDANSGLPAWDSSSVAGEGAGMSELRRKVPLNLIPHNWVKQNRAYIHHHNVLDTSSVCLLSVSVCCVSCVFCFSSPGELLLSFIVNEEAILKEWLWWGDNLMLRIQQFRASLVTLWHWAEWRINQLECMAW